MNLPMNEFEDDNQIEDDVTVCDRKEVKRPSLYKVLLHNDDYTTMEFVIYILQKFFLKSHEEAQNIMLEVHHNEVGVCGIYTHEVAETKMVTVSNHAKKEGFPLKCTIEQE